MAYETIHMSAGGKDFTGWTAVSVTAEMGTVPRTFDIQVTEIGPFGISPFSIWHFPPSTPVSLTANGDLLLTGHVDDYAPAGDAESHTVTIRGRGYGGGYVKNSVFHPTGQWENKTILQIAQDMGKPFGVTVKVAASAAAAAAELIPWFQIRRGSSPFVELMRLLPQRGVTLTENEQGQVVLTRAEAQTHSGGLIQGRNILRMAAVLSDAGRFEKYIVTGQESIGTEDENHEVEGEAGGPPAGSNFTFNEVIDMSETNKARAQAHAEWRKLRAAGLSRSADITVPGFRDDGGKLWTPGWNVFVMAPWLKIEQAMMIKTATFVQNDQEGTVTNLSLVDPRAFGGKSGQIGSGEDWGVF